MNEILRQLEALNGQVTSDIIRDLIEDHAATRARMLSLYDRYRAEKLPIQQREFEDKAKINNKLNNDFFSDTVDTKVGYFAGKPIVYQLDQEQYVAEVSQDPKSKPVERIDRRAYARAMEPVNRFLLVNNVDDLDSETAKMAATCGLAARLLYVDREGQERVMPLPPWEVIPVFDRSIDELQFALRYYDVQLRQGKEKVTRTRVEWYDDTMVTFYIEDGQGKYVLDDTELARPHLFDFVPIVLFENNEEHQGDAEKVLPLIDAYDRSLSDVNSEIEQFRLAYMAFYGTAPDEETIKQAQRTGAFGVDVGDKIEFITKNLNDTVIEHHLDRLDRNIMRFAKSVNFTDEAFAGNLSGVALKFKLFNLEAKCMVAERKFTTALRRMWQIVCSAWAKKGINIDYTQIFMQFKRNFPLNLLDEAQSTATLKGLVSEKTRLSLLSFVDDVDYELEEMTRDADISVDLDRDEVISDEPRF